MTCTCKQANGVWRDRALRSARALTLEAIRWAVRPNRRLQLTAFGARDRGHFDSFCCASAAAEAQHVGLPHQSHTIVEICMSPRSPSFLVEYGSGSASAYCLCDVVIYRSLTRSPDNPSHPKAKRHDQNTVVVVGHFDHSGIGTRY